MLENPSEKTKATRIIYWTLTILFAGFMAFTAIPDILMVDEAKKMFEPLGLSYLFIAFYRHCKNFRQHHAYNPCI